ncbi:DUF4231 domain-containing protein [Amycolatopsis sp. NPDC088138]|uniref:DUF4231 domain-containing protein n=1 Tax=Amycolatopsis sp. NPDC088138 TaxID=3363938 RepID=UPI00380D0A75
MPKKSLTHESMTWLFEAKSADGVPVPASVLSEWARYTRTMIIARNRHGALEITSLLVTATIPACAAFDTEGHWIALLGSIAIILNGGRQLFGWKESWVNRKRVRHSIEREVALFTVGAGSYGTPNASRVLVESIAEICAEERADWHARKMAYEGRSASDSRLDTKQ